MAGFDARRLLPPGAYDVTTDPLQKIHPGVKPRETPEQPSWPRLSGRGGAGLGAADARRGLRGLKRLSSGGRPGQVSAGAGRLRARGAGQGGGTSVALALGRLCSRRPALPSPAERRTAAVLCAASPGCRRGRAPSACQSLGPSPRRVRQHAHPGAEPPVRARPCSRPTLPVRSRRGGHGWPARSCRCTVQTANCSQAAGLPVTDATVPVRGRFSDPEVWRKVVQRCEVGLERRCCRSALLPPPGTRGSAGALALWLLSATWDAFR